MRHLPRVAATTTGNDAGHVVLRDDVRGADDHRATWRVSAPTQSVQDCCNASVMIAAMPTRAMTTGGNYSSAETFSAELRGPQMGVA